MDVTSGHDVTYRIHWLQPTLAAANRKGFVMKLQQSPSTFRVNSTRSWRIQDEEPGGIDLNHFTFSRAEVSADISAAYHVFLPEPNLGTTSGTRFLWNWVGSELGKSPVPRRLYPTQFWLNLSAWQSKSLSHESWVKPEHVLFGWDATSNLDSWTHPRYVHLSCGCMLNHTASDVCHHDIMAINLANFIEPYQRHVLSIFLSYAT